MSAKTFERATTFAQLPPPGAAFPADVPDQCVLVTDVGPAPGIELVSDGRVWRPRGGRQVLAMMAGSPVTGQFVGGIVVATMGPFPGGLVGAGMRLELEVEVDYSSSSTSPRAAYGLINAAEWWRAEMTDAGAGLLLRKKPSLNVLSDTSAAMPIVGTTPLTYAAGLPIGTITADFSAPWTADIRLTSATEASAAIAGATWAAGIATITTATAHALAVGDRTSIAGATPTTWNFGAVVRSVPDATTFTVARAADPGVYVSGGTSTRISNVVLNSYVLELVG